MKLTIKEECSADIKELLFENKSLVENIERELKYSSKSFSINVEIVIRQRKRRFVSIF